MAIDCCKSYVGKQIIGLLPGGGEECLYVLAINSQDYFDSSFIGWTLNGNDFITELANYGTVIQYQNDTGNYSVYVYYTGTEPTDLNVSTTGGDVLFTIRKVTDFEGGSCDLVCYQASFDYGYEYRYIDYFAAGGASPRLYGAAQPIDEVSLYGQLAAFLGTQITISTVWDGSQYVVTINNAFNLGGFQLGDGVPVYTSFTALPCEIVPPSPEPFRLLTQYPGATAGYSVRKLSESYTGSALRVRRSSDNSEQDIGFDSNGNIDTASLSSFVGAGNGFITKWYDQSGNNIDLIQTSAAEQPQIVSSGTIITQNGLPSISFDRANSTFLACAVGQESNFDFTSSFGFFFVVKPKTQTGDQVILDKGQFNFGNSGYYFAVSTSSNYVSTVINSPTGNVYFLNTSSTNLQVLSFNLGSGTFIRALNNTNTATSNGVPNATTNNTALHIGKYGTSSEDWDGWMSEIIIYPTSQSANRTGIETNMDNYFSLY